MTPLLLFAALGCSGDDPDPEETGTSSALDSGAADTQVDSADFYVARVKASGKAAWLAGSGGLGKEVLTGLASDPMGNIALVGRFSFSLPLGKTTLSSAGGDDIFVVRMQGSGP